MGGPWQPQVHPHVGADPLERHDRARGNRAQCPATYPCEIWRRHRRSSGHGALRFHDFRSFPGRPARHGDVRLSARTCVRRISGSVHRRLDQPILRVASRVPGGRTAGPGSGALVPPDREGTRARHIGAAEGGHTPATGERDASVHDGPEMLRAASLRILLNHFHAIWVWHLDRSISGQDPASQFRSDRHLPWHRKRSGRPCRHAHRRLSIGLGGPQRSALENLRVRDLLDDCRTRRAGVSVLAEPSDFRGRFLPDFRDEPGSCGPHRQCFAFRREGRHAGILDIRAVSDL